MFSSVYRNHTSGSNACSSSQRPQNAISRFWSLSQRAVRRSSPTSRHPRVALRFILGPAVLTVSTRWVTSVAYCEADVNNNIPVAATSKHTAPEFKWHILWEFVKPQLFALIGAIVVRFKPFTFKKKSCLPWCFLNVHWPAFSFSACFWSSHLEYQNTLIARGSGQRCGTIPARTHSKLCPRDQRPRTEITRPVWSSGKLWKGKLIYCSLVFK